MSSDLDNIEFLVASRLRNYVNQKELKLSDETIKSLNESIRQIVDKAIERTKANKRITVRPYDI